MAEEFVAPTILILRQRYPSEFPGYKWICLSPYLYPVNRNKLSPWITTLLLLQVSKKHWLKAGEKSLPREVWHDLTSPQLLWITVRERWADFWMGGTRTDESLYLWWHGLMTIAVRGFSCRLWNHIKGCLLPGRGCFLQDTQWNGRETFRESIAVGAFPIFLWN